MKSTFKVIFYLKKDKIKLNGKAPVFCRITIDGSVTRFSLKTEIDPELWNIDFPEQLENQKKQ